MHLTVESAGAVVRFPAVPLDVLGDEAVRFRAHPVPSCSDPTCTAVEAHLRFAGVPVRVRRTGNASASPTGALPAVFDEATADAWGADPWGAGAVPLALRRHLALRGYDLDGWLGDAQRRESVALSALVDRLHRATLFNAWLEPANYRCVTRPSAAASSALPFPLGRAAAWTTRTAVAGVLGLTPPRGRILGIFSVTIGASAAAADDKGAHDPAGEAAGGAGSTDFDDASDVPARHARAWARLYADAAEAYRVLEAHLASRGSAWFFGDRPSSLDALVYAHVAHQLLNPVPVPPLRDLAQRHPRLVAYVARISGAYAWGSASEAVGPGGAQSQEEWDRAVQRSLYAARQAADRARKRAAARRKRWEGDAGRRAMFTKYRWILGTAAASYALIPIAHAFFVFRQVTYQAEELQRRVRRKEAELDWRLAGAKEEDRPPHLVPRARPPVVAGTGMVFRYRPAEPGAATATVSATAGDDDELDDEDDEDDEGMFDDE